VFFHVATESTTPIRAVIADVNLRVMRTYEEVKWEPVLVADRLRQLEAGYIAAEDKVAFYNDVRAQHNRIYPSADAARFIFLMNTAWNGVFRINQSGAFNVPHGAPKGVLKLPTELDLRAVSAALENARLRTQSWETGITEMSSGDFAFFDPP
jgi:DNA adenine methylase